MKVCTIKNIILCCVYLQCVGYIYHALGICILVDVNASNPSTGIYRKVFACKVSLYSTFHKSYLSRSALPASDDKLITNSFLLLFSLKKARCIWLIYWTLNLFWNLIFLIILTSNTSAYFHPVVNTANVKMIWYFYIHLKNHLNVNMT